MSAAELFGLRKAERVTITEVLIQVDSKRQKGTMYFVIMCILRDIKGELLSARNWYLTDYQVMIPKYTQLLWTSSKVIKHLKYACFVYVYIRRKIIRLLQTNA